MTQPQGGGRVQRRKELPVRGNGEDWMSAAQAACWLQKRHPCWNITLTRGRSGLRFAAVRDGFPEGVSAVVGGFDEVRSVLEPARRSRHRAGA